MRYAIYKLTFIVAIFLSLLSCESSHVSNFNSGYYVGVISFNKTKKVSFINQYNEDGRETNKIKFSIEGMGYLDDFIPSDEDNFYVKSSNILSRNGKNYLIEVDKFTNRYSKIDLNLEDIYKIFNDDDYIYITHSINKLSRYDKDRGRIIDTVKLDDYIVNKFYVDESKIYLFSRRGKERSFLNILDKETLELIKNFDITYFGLYQNDIFYDNGKIYFTNYDVSSNSGSGKIGIYSIETQKFTYINVNSKNLNKILVYNDKVYVTIKGDEEDILKDAIIIIDKNSLKSQKKTLDYNVKVFDIIDDKIFILSDKYLDIYDADDFSLYKRIKLSIDSDSVVSGIIVYDF